MRARGLLDCEVMRVITRHERAPYNRSFSSNICKALKEPRAVLRTLSETGSVRDPGASRTAVGTLERGNRSRPVIACKMGETLLTHLVGASEQRGRQLQAKSSCRFLVHDQLEFGWGLNRQLGRTGTP